MVISYPYLELATYAQFPNNPIVTSNNTKHDSHLIQSLQHKRHKNKLIQSHDLPVCNSVRTNDAFLNNYSSLSLPFFFFLCLASVMLTWFHFSKLKIKTYSPQ